MLPSTSPLFALVALFALSLSSRAVRASPGPLPDPDLSNFGSRSEAKREDRPPMALHIGALGDNVVLHSHNPNEGDGEGQKAPWGAAAREAVFDFVFKDDYKTEIFRAMFYEGHELTPPPEVTDDGSYDAWTETADLLAFTTGTPTLKVECTASITDSLTLRPYFGLTETNLPTAEPTSSGQATMTCSKFD